MSDTVRHSETQSEGNTKLHSNRARRWCLTLNNYTEEEHKHILNIFDDTNCKYIIGKEVGESNTPHLQIYVEYVNARSFNYIKNICNRLHIEKARGNRMENFSYCSKDNNYISNFSFKKKIIDPLHEKNLRPFQEEIINIFKKNLQDDRKIHWYWEPDGNVGKTALAKHLCIKYPNKILFMNGKGSDIKYGVYSFLQNEENELELCIFHFTRSVENFISYEALESIKDGIFYNTKYESGMCIFNSPTIICLANFEPEKNKLSTDRWIIKKINGQILPLDKN